MQADLCWKSHLQSHLKDLECSSFQHTKKDHNDIHCWMMLCNFRFTYMMTSSNGNIHQSTVDSPHKGLWRWALIFPWICARTNSWEHNRYSVDLIHPCAHYDVTIMKSDRFYRTIIFLAEHRIPFYPLNTMIFVKYMRFKMEVNHLGLLFCPYIQTSVL